MADSRQKISCPKCSAPILHEGKFCGVCGTTLEIEQGEFLATNNYVQLEQSKITPQSFFLGREDELELIAKLAHKSLNSHGSVLHLVGRPGIGKTALTNQLYGFFNENNFFVQRVSGEQEYALLSFHPFQQLISKLVGVKDGMSQREIIDCLQKLHNFGLSDAEVCYLSMLFPVEMQKTNNSKLDDSVQLLGLGAAIIRLIRNMARRKPMLLVLDHLQWVDPFTIRLIKMLESVTENERLLVITCSRESRISDNSARHITELDLKPLGIGQIIPIARMYLKSEKLPSEVEERLEEVTFGLPLAVFFFLDFLQEKDYLVFTGNKWQINPKLKNMGFPKGLVKILELRQKMLKPHMRELLWLIAISSTECTVNMLASLYSYPEHLVTDLEELANKHLLRIISTLDEKKVVYTHNYLTELIYQTIPGSGLASYHPKISTYIRLNEPNKAFMKTWLSAYHMSFQNAQPEQLVHILERVADNLVRQLHFYLAAQCYLKVSQLLYNLQKRQTLVSKNIMEQKLILVMKKHARCYRAMGDSKRCEKVFKETIALSRAVKEGYNTLDLLLELCDLYLEQGNIKQAKENCKSSIKIAQVMGDQYFLSISKLRLGICYQRAGKFKQSEYELAEALAGATEYEQDVSPSKRWSAEILKASGYVKTDQAKYDEALPLLKEALLLANQNKNIPLANEVTQRLAIVYACQKKYDKAIGLLKQGMQISREIGDRLSLANLSYLAGRYLLEKGDTGDTGDTSNTNDAKMAFFDALQICLEINWEQGIKMSRIALDKIDLNNPGRGKNHVQS